MEHIHANEIILVLGYSRTVLHFLRRAAEKRSFEVRAAAGGWVWLSVKAVAAAAACVWLRGHGCAPPHASTLLSISTLLPSARVQVVVTEGGPTYQGQRMASELAGAGIHATLVADAAVFAMMARVNKASTRRSGRLE